MAAVIGACSFAEAGIIHFSTRSGGSFVALTGRGKQRGRVHCVHCVVRTHCTVYEGGAREEQKLVPSACLTRSDLLFSWFSPSVPCAAFILPFHTCFFCFLYFFLSPLVLACLFLLETEGHQRSSQGLEGVQDVIRLGSDEGVDNFYKVVTIGSPWSKSVSALFRQRCNNSESQGGQVFNHDLPRSHIRAHIDNFRASVIQQLDIPLADPVRELSQH